MDIITFIAGILALSVVMGHFIFGINWYLVPMKKAEFDLIPKATMQSVFHYVTVFLVLSSAALIISGMSVLPKEKTELLVYFIGGNYIMFSLVQIMYSIINKVEKPLLRMFQWAMFLPIGILCFL